MEKSIINSKVCIIDKEGQPYLIGRVNDKHLHVNYLLAYVKYKYPGMVIDKLYVGNSRDRIALALGKLGDIIYLNENSFGIFYFPDALSDEQLRTFDKLNFGNQEVGVFYNLKDLGESVNFRTIGYDGNYTLKDALEEFLDKKKMRR